MTQSPHIDLNSLVLFFGACQAFLFIVLLAFKRQRMRVINLHLAILLFAIGSEVFHQFLLQTQYIRQVPWLLGFSLPTDALVAISLYWYVRIITHPETEHGFRRVFMHYWIFLSCVLLSIPFWSMDFDTKLSLMETGVVPSDWPGLPYYATILQIPIKIVSFIVYLIFSIGLLLRHRARIQNIFSYRERVTLNWLSALLVLFILGLLNGLIVLVFFQEYSGATQVMGFMSVFSLSAIFYIGIMGLMQPVIYLRKEQSYLEEVKAEAESPPNNPQDNPSKTKYKHSSLAEEDMTRIAAKLDLVLREQKLYLDPTISMPSLASSIGVSPNYLSQTINSVYQANFFDYINGLRIEFAKQLLKDPQKKHLSIVDIAMESAFNSRSTFYSAFKQCVGMTPAKFRQSQSH